MHSTLLHLDACMVALAKQGRRSSLDFGQYGPENFGAVRNYDFGILDRMVRLVRYVRFWIDS